MSQNGVEIPCRVMEAFRHRRYPHLTAQDVEDLDALRAELGPAAARDYERLLEAQHRDAERHAERHVLLEDVQRPALAERAA